MQPLRPRIGLVIAAGLVGAAIVAPAAVSATQPDPLHKVTICHRTNSVTNPYVVITVDEASVDGDAGNDNGQGDHLLEHLGAAFDFSADPDVMYPAPHNGDQWGDIVPPFYADGQTPTGYPTLNWDADGQAIFEAGCAAPAQSETPSEPVESETPSEPVESETPSEPAETPEGSVEAETGTPVATPPSTDTISGGTGRSGDPMPLLLLLGSVALAAGLSADRVRARARR